MKLRLLPIAVLALAPFVCTVPATAAEADAAVAVVTELAQINGQALACQAMDAVSRAKKLMLAHAPKTPRYGTLFEEATNASYLVQVRSEIACPDAAGFGSKLNAVAKRLEAALPAAPAAAQ
jgi:hypothetical protein